MTHDKQKQVLDFWFGDDTLQASEKADLWFAKDPSFDASIRSLFGDMTADAASGAFDDWAKTPRGAVALVLLLDQFPRNLFRDDKLAFVNDDRARRVAEIAVDRGFDKKLAPLERLFLYLPLEHAEDIVAQERSVELVESLINEAQTLEERQLVTQALAAALEHRDIVAKFGRFPSRNEALGRETSKAEAAFLKTPFSSF